MESKNWMALLDGNKNIFSLNIPGAHDCVTQFIKASHFYRCQDKSIYDLLCIGVRCLDIRVERLGGERLVMVHRIFRAYNDRRKKGSCMTMADVLEQCYTFLGENPSECIIFQFKNDSGKDMQECFDVMYKSYIAKHTDRWYLDDGIPTLDEARGKIILLRRCKKYDENSYPLGTGIDFSGWVEQAEAIPTPLTLKCNAGEFVIQDRFKYAPVKKWDLCVKPMLDNASPFSGEYRINYLSTAGGIKGPYNNALYINEKFMQYNLVGGKYYGTIYCDFAFKALAEKIALSNFDGEAKTN